MTNEKVKIPCNQQGLEANKYQSSLEAEDDDANGSKDQRMEHFNEIAGKSGKNMCGILMARETKKFYEKKVELKDN